MFNPIREEREVVEMMNRVYVVDGSLEMNRKEFENFLIELIHENELYDLPGLHGDDSKWVERHVKHHPYWLALQIFGENRVVTFQR